MSIKKRAPFLENTSFNIWGKHARCQACQCRDPSQPLCEARWLDVRMHGDLVDGSSRSFASHDAVDKLVQSNLVRISAQTSSVASPATRKRKHGNSLPIERALCEKDRNKTDTKIESYEELLQPWL